MKSLFIAVVTSVFCGVAVAEDAVHTVGRSADKTSQNQR